jgi:hypothetical protein
MKPDSLPDDATRAPDDGDVKRKLARWAGIALQGLILGVLLFGASVTLLVMQSGARIFRYENF